MDNKVAICSANEKYNYDNTYYNIKLSELINTVHSEYSKEMKWEYRPLWPGQFGYDNMACSIAYALSNSTKDTTELKLAELIHEGWIINYVYWRDHMPYETNTKYKKPFVALGDDRRNKCAKSQYNELDTDEQTKDLIIAKILKKLINYNI